MKKIFFVLAVMTLISSCTGNKTKNDLAKNNIKGKVRTITESQYSGIEKFGEAQKKSLVYKKIYTYNHNGNLTEECTYKPDGSLKIKTNNKYDEKGNLTEENNYSPDKNSFFNYKCIYKYDEKGNRTELNNYNFDGDLHYKQTYEHDDNGNLVGEKHYNPDGSFRDNPITYKYDDNSNVVDEKHNNADGTVSAQITYIYDNNRKNTEQNFFVNEKLFWHGIYSYDENGNVVEEIYLNPDNSIRKKMIYKYSNNDKEENWTMQLIFFDNILELITERVIEYY